LRRPPGTGWPSDATPGSSRPPSSDTPTRSSLSTSLHPVSLVFVHMLSAQSIPLAADLVGTVVRTGLVRVYAPVLPDRLAPLHPVRNQLERLLGYLVNPGLPVLGPRLGRCRGPSPGPGSPRRHPLFVRPVLGLPLCSQATFGLPLC